MATGWEAWEAYFYPETYNPATRQGTLRNKFGERNAHRLDIRERAATAARAQQLAAGHVQIDRSFGVEHLQQIHRHLFQDVYDWAGELRTVRMQKDEETEFARPRRGEIRELLTQVQEHIRTVDWRALDRRGFVNNAAAVIAFTNQAHPFREGNGRTTQWFMRHIADQTPFQLDFTRIDPDAWNEASAASSPRLNREWIDPRPLIPLLDAASEQSRRSPRLEAPSHSDRLAALRKNVTATNAAAHENAETRRKTLEEPGDGPGTTRTTGPDERPRGPRLQ